MFAVHFQAHGDGGIGEFIWRGRGAKKLKIQSFGASRPPRRGPEIVTFGGVSEVDVSEADEDDVGAAENHGVDDVFATRNPPGGLGGAAVDGVEG